MTALTPEEKAKVKNMLHFLVKRKCHQSGGHCGFHPNELLEILDELEQEKKIISRNTLHSNRYFLVKNDT